MAPSRRAWLFRGSDRGSNRGGDRAAALHSLLVTAKLNGTDPRAWLAGVLHQINNHPASRLLRHVSEADGLQPAAEQRDPRLHQAGRTS